MTIITIDGNIGACKSTILNNLHKKYKINIDLEPIDKWSNYLDDLYNNNNIFNFQLKVWLDRAWIQEKKDKVVLLMERSPYFIKNTFNKSAYINKNITDNEYNILSELFSKTDDIWKSNKYIYLQSDPKKCLERILERGRTYECNNIKISYLNQIHKLHEETYENLKAINKDIIVINIEDKTIDDITDLIVEYINK